MSQSSSQSNPPAGGQLFVIAAPSGAGKTTLVHRLMKQDPGLRFSKSYTTRPQRANAKHGDDYFFVDKKTFDQMEADAEFLEHALVFDYHYGTSRNQVDDLLAKGHNVILEIDWQGARQVRSNMPQCCSVFVMPPSLELLEQRLRGRSTDSEDVIKRRLGDARSDMTHWDEFDYVVINDDLEAAVAALQAILSGKNLEDRTDSAEVRSQAAAIAGK